MPFKTTFNFFLGLLMLWSGRVNAQSYHNLMSVGYNSEAHLPSDGPGHLSLFYLRASLPLKLKSGDYVLLNPDLHRQVLSFPTGDAICYKTAMTSAYMKMMKKGNFITVLNLSNNFEKGGMAFGSLQMGAGVLATRKVNPRLKLKLGLYCNREFFGPLIVPLFGIDYKIAPAIRLFGVMPQNMRLEFRHGGNFRSVFLFESPLNTYRTFGNTESRYIDQRQILLGLSEDLYLGKNLVMQVSFKYPLFNRQRLFSSRQTYKANIWGVGVGGERVANPESVISMQHTALIECSFNYRIEVD